MSVTASKRRAPIALIDDLKSLEDQIPPEEWSDERIKEFDTAREFLLAYQGSKPTFDSYRRELERLLQWSWFVARKSIFNLHRRDIEDFAMFCKSPPKSWVGVKRVPKFLSKEGLRIPNKQWRPFVATVPKAQRRKGVEPDKAKFQMQGSALKDMLAIVSSFYGFLLLEELVPSNPVALIRQKSRFVRKHQGAPKIRRLTNIQWNYVLQTTERLAEIEPIPYERSLFMISALYSMYLRISELAASARWTPQMSDFARDQDGEWWFTTVGKGNKLRTIAVSDQMLEALKRWRSFLGLSPLPSPADNSALIPRLRGEGPITHTSHIRRLIQNCFDAAVEELSKQGLDEEAQGLQSATVHWLRHTGISDDVQLRPREHVRDDAGHGSGATTDRYVSVHLRERHRSAKDKPILKEKTD